jgi:cell division transport system permease protein
MTKIPGKKRGRRGRPNYLYSIFSVAMVLFILGLIGLFILYGNELIRYLRENVNILVEIKPGTERDEVINLQQVLRKMPFVKTNSVTFHTKEEALQELQKDFGDEFTTLDMANPLYDVLSFNVRSRFMNSDSLKQLSRTILEQTIVRDVFYQESLIEELSGNIRKIILIGFGLGVLALILAFVLIHNTIRLALFSNRFLIKNMELVGASWEFITRPYLLRSLLHGLLSALLAVGALFGLLALAYIDIPELQTLENRNALFFLFLGLIVAGLFITGLSTYYAVNKFLRMRLEDLY